MQVIEMQRMLQALGYDIGPTGADGAIGRRTTDAVAAFQRAAGLNVVYPGTVGPKTEAALAAAYAARTGADVGVSATPLLPWLAEAKRLRGVEEIPGARSNSTIMSWARR
ncbi:MULTISPECIES: peptidoglycan-binding domain-containing protein [unclassified Xanthobacter]|uniref:peptidoglycan-binding domain-containing protein n=1 Tax=unclassified Xanthobacter TaxID=2623496 RepID=UPI001EDE0D93|nr:MULTISPECIES: peptidoglycan-binding protein [unclassified Xanthobacter]